jgi:hypothetical protein
MSSSIWTECAGDSEIRALVIDAWRVVESQHQIATRKLVSTDAEQELLEALIDAVKPPDVTRGRLHYLLFTPFRYPPLRHGSRFGTRQERGIWYGSETRAAAFAEVAYYRLLFLEGTKAVLPVVEVDLTAFRAAIRTSRGIDLNAAPFDAYVSVLASPTSYRATQALGGAMRGAGVEAFRYVSARDARGGINVGAFVPSVFGRRQPRALETWRCSATRERVELTRRDYFKRASFAFGRDQFLVDGVLPAPAV